MLMDKDLKKNIIILALDNLISSYSIALEDAETTLEKEDIETMQEIIQGAQEILLEYSQDITTPRPQWNKISKT